jgi:hypothetical protein
VRDALLQMLYDAKEGFYRLSIQPGGEIVMSTYDFIEAALEQCLLSEASGI